MDTPSDKPEPVRHPPGSHGAAQPVEPPKPPMPPEIEIPPAPRPGLPPARPPLRTPLYRR